MHGHVRAHQLVQLAHQCRCDFVLSPAEEGTLKQVTDTPRLIRVDFVTTIAHAIKVISGYTSLLHEIPVIHLPRPPAPLLQPMMVPMC